MDQFQSWHRHFKFLSVFKALCVMFTEYCNVTWSVCHMSLWCRPLPCDDVTVICDGRQNGQERTDILPSKTQALYTFCVLHVLRNHLSNQGFKTVQNRTHEHRYIFNISQNTWDVHRVSNSFSHTSHVMPHWLSAFTTSWSYHVAMTSLVPDYSIGFHTTSHYDYSYISGVAVSLWHQTNTVTQ
jgi:hypothetical protein